MRKDHFNVAAGKGGAEIQIVINGQLTALYDNTSQFLCYLFIFSFMI